MTTSFRSLSIFVSSLALLALAACGGGGGGSGGTGTLGVSLTDSPACGFSAVNVTVSKVRVHQSSTASSTDGGWIDIALNPARKINLLDLSNGVLTGLGETALPAGHYTQLRLVLDRNAGVNVANSVVLSGTTTEIPLDTPSAVQSGIKLINEFDVAANERTDLLLDFDACKSVVTTGNGTYLLKPVIEVIPFVLNGINGYVDPSLMDSTNSQHVMVFAEQNGEVVRATAPMSSGQFVLARLNPGTYDVVFVANGHATAVITGVPVASTTSTTPVSTQTQPIILPSSSSPDPTVSGTITLNPANADVVAFATAKQTLNPGPTVTVRSHSVDQDLNNFGAYSLALPTAAPLLGAYATPLPIVLSASAQGSVAAHYTIEASADGYQTQSSSVDLSNLMNPYNFTLAP
jgi:hypothetical protein